METRYILDISSKYIEYYELEQVVLMSLRTYMPSLLSGDEDYLLAVF